MYRSINIIVFATIVGCAHVPGFTADQQDLPITRLRPLPGSYTVNSGISEPMQLIIGSRSEFEELWRLVHSGRRPSPPLPDIDFNIVNVVLVALGEKKSGGFEVTVRRAYRDGESVVVVVDGSEPGDRCVVSTGLTQPLDIVLIPRIEAEHEFEMSIEKQSCH
jgi:hypothetical protein